MRVSVLETKSSGAAVREPVRGQAQVPAKARKQNALPARLQVRSVKRKCAMIPVQGHAQRMALRGL
jgi:hypothetical protein